MDPLPTQIEDADFLSSQGKAALFSEPGTGKTLTALEAYKKVGGRLVVAAPPIALRMWEDNIMDHLGASVQRIQKRADTVDPTADAIVVSYGNLPYFPNLRGDVVVLDESDALKTLSSQRTKAAYGTRCSGKDCLIEGADYVWPMTGTPIRRYADDLYPQLRALHPQALKGQLRVTSLVGFQQQFCVTQLKRFHPRQPAKPTVIGSKNEEVLREFIYGNDFAVRRTIHDVAKYMPPVTISDIEVDYDDSEELQAAVGGLVSMTEDDAVMATARRLLGVAKAPYVVQYMKDIWQGLSCPILVLYWHKEVGHVMREMLRADGFSVDLIDGATSSENRYSAEKRFNGGYSDFLLGQISSMGVAINLQAGGHYAVFAEEDWSPASKDQALRRVWRLGQDTHVQVDICRADHDIDQAVSNVIDRKDVAAGKIINA